MATVGLDLGKEPPADLVSALGAAGFTVADRDAGAADDFDFRVLGVGDMTHDEAATIVRFVVDGGSLLLCGAGGSLSAALNLTAGPAPVDGVTPVTGVGYALEKIDDRCVLLGAPRGRGAVAYLGDNPPPPMLAVAALRWLAEMRSQYPGTK